MLHRKTAGYLAFCIIVTVTVIVAIAVRYGWGYVAAETSAILKAFVLNPAVPEAPRRDKPERQTAKAVYLTAASAADTRKLAGIIKIIDETELNAVVIDIKDYSGYVLYDSNVPLVNELKLERRVIKNIPNLIKLLRNHNIYAIARQVVFQDPVLAKQKPAWAIQSASGTPWRDYKGLAWVDPTRQEIWEYNAAIAKEAIAGGFDEINFDYIRFPSDGNLKAARYQIPVRKKYLTMADFYAFMDQALAGEPALVSFDLFGFVMERRGEDDLQIGQRLADAAGHADYIAPMMYPSHYPSGHLGLKNPAAEPVRVIENGLKQGAPVLAGQRAELRPWIQAFNLGAVYDGEKIRAQIDTVEKYTSAGWMLWNAANRYTSAGLRSE